MISSSNDSKIIMATILLLFPTVLGAAVPTYNLPGITAELNFTPAALAGIFLGNITNGTIPQIAESKP